MANLLRMFPGLTILDLLSYLGKREVIWGRENFLSFFLCHFYKDHTVATLCWEM